MPPFLHIFQIGHVNYEAFQCEAQFMFFHAEFTMKRYLITVIMKDDIPEQNPPFVPESVKNNLHPYNGCSGS